MVFMGSKAKIASSIAPILQKCIDDNNIDTYIECFVGGGNMIEHIRCKNRYGYDRSDTLIALLTQMRDDFDKVLKDGNRELWDKGKAYVKDGIMPDDMTLAEIGAMEFFASFSNGGFPRGYAKNTDGRNYFNEAYRNAEKQAPNLKGIKFGCQNYWELDPNISGTVIYCFDKDTEILTKDGWKYLKDVDISTDTFLSREPNTKKLDYLKAVHYTNYHYKGKMFHYTGRQLDFCVTPDHKIFYMKKYGRAREKQEGLMPAEEFSTKGENYCFVKAGGEWQGENPQYFNLCGQQVNFVKFARLLGIFVTDGCINNQDNITIAQSKPNIQKIIEDLLVELNIQHSIYNGHTPGSKIYYLSRKYIPFFKQFYLKENRHIPTEFKNASKEAIQSLIEGILDGDSDQERRKIWCGSIPLRDDIQECLYKIGLASNYVTKKGKPTYLASEDRVINGHKDYYIISVLKTEYPIYNRENIVWEDYDDEVYCVTLEKWHTVLTRRNGKTIWLGQCDSPYANTKQYGYARQGKFDFDKYHQWCREISKNNYVFISEQTMPDDFEIIWEQECKRTAGKDNNFKAVERLFRYKDGLK